MVDFFYFRIFLVMVDFFYFWKFLLMVDFFEIFCYVILKILPDGQFSTKFPTAVVSNSENSFWWSIFFRVHPPLIGRRKKICRNVLYCLKTALQQWILSHWRLSGGVFVVKYLPFCFYTTEYTEINFRIVVEGIF